METQKLSAGLDLWKAQHAEFMRQREERKAMQQIETDHTKRQAEEESLTPEQKQRARIADMNIAFVDTCIDKILNDMHKAHEKRVPLEINEVYKKHAKLLLTIADNILLYQHRKFEVDENNQDILRFLLYYFNDCPLAEDVFPGRGYKLHKHIMLQGATGCGKTLLMEIFSEYLRRTKNPNFFYNLSVTQMVNYYTLHNNLDRYTFNEEEGKGFQSKPVNVCLNDIGVQTSTFYNKDTTKLVDEFLHARNDIWTQQHLKGHVTTNLTNDLLREKFQDGFGRLSDRFKTYNVIPIPGGSRR